MMEPNTTIREFYKGRNILVTGGTGFMGKVLVEKLLYSVPDLGNIYIIIRPKRGKTVEQRLEAIQMLAVFDRIRNTKPSLLKKIVALHGDVLLDNLGLSDREIDQLSEEISVVFHFAATLKLEAPLIDNVNMNTKGTQRALDVAKRLKKLDIFVHLSTAFCYPDYQVLEEQTHAPTVKPENIFSLINLLDEKQIAMITPSILGRHPNCYTFSKRLAEHLVASEQQNLPLVIARPSIVSPATKEPVQGWVDSLNGPIGIMLGAGKGVIRTMLCNGSHQAQVIPVDIATNAIIAIGMIEGSKSQKPEVTPVYNVNVGHQSPTTWREVLDCGKAYGRKYPLEWPLWYPNGDITTIPILHEVRRILYHLLPAYFIDLLMFLLGQKPFMVRIQNRISQGLEVLQFFTMRPWYFPCPNFDSIQSKLNDEEKVIFNTDASKEDKVEYIHNSIEGGRRYCLKEDVNRIPIFRQYHNFLWLLDWALKIFLFLFIFSILASWFPFVRTLFSYGEPIVKHLPMLGPAVFGQK